MSSAEDGGGCGALREGEVVTQSQQLRRHHPRRSPAASLLLTADDYQRRRRVCRSQPVRVRAVGRATTTRVRWATTTSDLRRTRIRCVTSPLNISEAQVVVINQEVMKVSKSSIESMLIYSKGFVVKYSWELSSEQLKKYINRGRYKEEKYHWVQDTPVAWLGVQGSLSPSIFSNPYSCVLAIHKQAYCIDLSEEGIL